MLLSIEDNSFRCKETYDKRPGNVCVCVCERESERESERAREIERKREKQRKHTVINARTNKYKKISSKKT
jgi:hypothetical protein